MKQEDIVAARLRGHNCLIKFKDGEELTLHVPSLSSDDEDAISYTLVDMEKFINKNPEQETFPVSGIALCRDSVKYIFKI